MVKGKPAKRAAPAAKTTRIRCIVVNRPWTHQRPLEHGEEADVPEEVATLLLTRNFVVCA